MVKVGLIMVIRVSEKVVVVTCGRTFFQILIMTMLKNVAEIVIKPGFAIIVLISLGRGEY